MLVVSRKIVFIENYAWLCGKGICSYNLVYNFLIYLLSLQDSVCVVPFSNAFWHGNKAFAKGSSQNEIVPLLIIFQYIKIIIIYSIYILYIHSIYIFTLAVTKIKIFHSCHTRVTFVSLVFDTCVVNQTKSSTMTKQNALENNLWFNLLTALVHWSGLQLLFCEL